MLICSKYLELTQDYINMICVCKKFKETTEKLRFNPIPITSLTLFPKIQTQYLYNEKDPVIEGINNYEIWYEVNFSNYLKIKNKMKCHHVNFTDSNRVVYGEIIPYGVTMLNKCCFNYSNIETITIPNNITSIGSSCFLECKSLKSIKLPNNITSLNDQCFLNCKALTSISLPSSLQSLGGDCFQYCKITNNIIPDSVTSIGCGCFFNCLSLQFVTLPKSLIQLKKKTFCYCSSLKNISLPTTITSIGSECFKGCKELRSITLPPSLRSVGCECFFDCGIESITLPKSIVVIGVYCFLKCTSLTNIISQSTNKQFTFKVSYNDSIIYNKFGIVCTNTVFTMNDINIKVDELEQQQISLTEIIIPNGVVEIHNLAFYYKTSLKSIIIPTTTTSINDYSFEGCISLTSFSIPDSVQKIGSFCFKNCHNLKKLTFPPHLHIDPNCFRGCDKIKFDGSMKSCKIC
ncbi:hypothetical protein QTN25_008991 [Entamoeba marina]